MGQKEATENKDMSLERSRSLVRSPNDVALKQGMGKELLTLPGIDDRETPCSLVLLGSI